MNRPPIQTPKKFVPSAAQMTPPLLAASLILTVFSTVVVWIGCKTFHPMEALALGLTSGIGALVVFPWSQRRWGPPSLVVSANALEIQQGRQRLVVPWEEITAVRPADYDDRCLEIETRPGSESVVIAVDPFSTDDAREIRSLLLRDAA